MQSRMGLTAAIYALFTALGVSSTIFGLVLSDATAALDISLAHAGLVTTLFAVGRIVGSFVSGPFTDRAGAPLVTGFGVFAMLLGVAGLGVAPVAAVFFAGGLVMGLGFGALDVALNTSISELHPKRRTSMLSLLHGFYGVGSFLGPLLLGLLITWTGSWRTAPALAVLTFIGATVWYRARVRMSTTTAGAEPQQSEPVEHPGLFEDAKPKRRVGLVKLLQQPAFLLIVPVGFIYQGVSWSLSLWLPTFMTAVHGASSLAAASAVSAVFGGLTLGRFINSVVARILGDGNTLLAGAAGALVALGVALWTPISGIALFALFLTGLFLSTLIPTSIAVLTRLWPDTAGTVSGVFMTISAAGVLIVPWFQGVLGHLWGVRAGLGSGVVALLLLVVLIVALRGLLQREKVGETEQA